VAVALSVGGVRERTLGTVNVTRINSLAVLPLENLSDDKEQKVFADGMTDELISELGKIGALRVISRTSLTQYKAVPKPLGGIAGNLNVDGVVEGTVLRSGNWVRITAELIRAATEKHLWAESYEGDLRDILALQGEVHDPSPTRSASR
jgi:TolB-like protein